MMAGLFKNELTAQYRMDLAMAAPGTKRTVIPFLRLLSDFLRDLP